MSKKKTAPTKKIQHRRRARRDYKRKCGLGLAATWNIHVLSALAGVEDPGYVTDKVIPAGSYLMHISYPLRHHAVVPLISEEPIPHSRIAQVACEAYREIYDTTAPLSDEERAPSLLINAQFPPLGEKNPYGLWGHAIEDLWLEGFDLGEDDIIQLWVGS